MITKTKIKVRLLIELVYALALGAVATRVGGPRITSDHQGAVLSRDTNSAPGLRAKPS